MGRNLGFRSRPLVGVRVAAGGRLVSGKCDGAVMAGRLVAVWDGRFPLTSEPALTCTDGHECAPMNSALFPTDQKVWGSNPYGRASCRDGRRPPVRRGFLFVR